MKDSFHEYYAPDGAELEGLWKTAVFVFDTNVLLNLYRYTASTRDQLLNILESLKERAWVPHQAALEYQTRRVGVIAKQQRLYDEKAKACETAVTKAKQSFNDVGKNRHPFIDADHFHKIFDECLATVVAELNEARDKHPDYIGDDQIRERISEIFTGRIGAPFSGSEVQTIILEGEERYKEKIPPGFEDDTKDGLGPYGDLLIWKEMLKHATETQRPMIFVTDDKKQDWWWKEGDTGRTIGPRPELRKEMREIAHVAFYMYQADRFMEFAKKYVGTEVDDAAIKEAKSIRLNDEMRFADSVRARQLSRADRLNALPEELIGRARAEDELSELNMSRRMLMLRMQELTAEREATQDDTVKGFAQREYLERRLSALLEETAMLEERISGAQSRLDSYAIGRYDGSEPGDRFEGARAAILGFLSGLLEDNHTSSVSVRAEEILDRLTPLYGFAPVAVALDSLRSQGFVHWAGNDPPGPSTVINFGRSRRRSRVDP